MVHSDQIAGSITANFSSAPFSLIAVQTHLYQPSDFVTSLSIMCELKSDLYQKPHLSTRHTIAANSDFRSSDPFSR
jgi:hypothetical protein